MNIGNRISELERKYGKADRQAFVPLLEYGAAVVDSGRKPATPFERLAVALLQGDTAAVKAATEELSEPCDLSHFTTEDLQAVKVIHERAEARRVKALEKAATI